MRLAAFTIMFVLAMAFPLAPVLGGEGGGEGPDLAGPSNSDPHPPSPPSTGERSKAFATTLPAMLQDVGIDQNIGAQVPADLVFRDESGKRVKLGDYYGKRPIVLALVYYRCPMLCTMVLNDLVRTLNAMPTHAGEDFDILTISFDPRETPELAAAKKRQYLAEYRQRSAASGWHFLTGDEESIRSLTTTVGFRYLYDPTSQQYVHASGLMVLTPQGTVSRYFYGIEYAPKDLRLALGEAAGGNLSSPVEKVLLYCFHYNPSTGRYSLAVLNVLKIAGALTVLALASFLIAQLRRERRPQGATP